MLGKERRQRLGRWMIGEQPSEISLLCLPRGTCSRYSFGPGDVEVQ
jgi:hypothetical protein